MRLSTTTGVLAKRFGYISAIEFIAQAGFDAYDFDMATMHVRDMPLSGSNYRNYLVQMKAKADEHGIVCNQAHAPFPTQLNGNEEYNKMTFDMITRSMECAAFLGGEIIVVHPIKNSSSSVAKGYDYTTFRSRQQLYEANVAFFNSLIPYCKKYKIKIAVENMWERHPRHRDTLIPAILGYYEEHLDFIKSLNSEWIVGCLDIGHSLICGEKPQDAIRHIGNRYLKALHIHDCNGYEDLHALPYFANTEWGEILEALRSIGYDGDFTYEADKFLENYPDDFMPSALHFMCELGRYMIGRISEARG